MRYFLFIITAMLIFSPNVEARKDSINESKVQAEALSKECYIKTIEPVEDTFYYNDEIKIAYKNIIPA